MSVLDFLAHESSLCLLILCDHFFPKFIFFLFCVALFYFEETSQNSHKLLCVLKLHFRSSKTLNLGY
jgi:hypothetical protein